ncbi:MAG: ribonuclease P protein component [Rickettsiaceae bacterium]
MSLHSLKNQKQFNLVNLHGTKKSSTHFMLIIAKKFDFIATGIKDPTFLGIKVSKKLSKKACVRNKIKRRIRHLARIMLNDSDLNLSKMAIIFIPYKGFEMIEFIKLSSEFKTTLLKRMSSK